MTKECTKEELAGLEGGRYEARYGDEWREKVYEKIGKGERPLINMRHQADAALH